MLLIVLLVLFVMTIFVWLLSLLGRYPQRTARGCRSSPV